MYLESISIENVGPIPKLEVSLPFENGLPTPVVLVGPNGSGKSTLLSFVVNALVAFKQQVFEEAEVEANRVYRIRSGVFLRGGANYYRAMIRFERGLSLEEWVLDRPKERFEKEVTPLPADNGWRQIEAGQANLFKPEPLGQMPPHGRQPAPAVEKLFSQNIVLFFPSDRFEPPDWLNEKSLSMELRFPEPMRMQGFTSRRIFSRSLLKPTLEWIQAVVLDLFLHDRRQVRVPLLLPDGSDSPPLDAFMLVPGKNQYIVDALTKLLGAILSVGDRQIQIAIDGRNSRRMSVLMLKDGQQPIHIPNLLGLSAGQSALFCLFCNIIRDIDLSGATFSTLEELRGIVLIDEADLHLHLDLQYRVLPELIRLFPKVQFILTVHSPLVVMGMKRALGEDGFWLLEMPSGRRITTEAYSEFVEAFEAFGRTRTFEERVLEQVRATAKPIVLVEGIHDESHLKIAWQKLNPGMNIDFEIVPCGGEAVSSKGGGAKAMKAILEALGWFEIRSVIGLFDNDKTGAEQFKSLAKDGFETTTENHRKHKKRAVHAVLLPTPVGRELFAPTDIGTRVLETALSAIFLHSGGQE